MRRLLLLPKSVRWRIVAGGCGGMAILLLANAILIAVFQKPTFNSLAVARLPEVEILSLGTSHVINGINPAGFRVPATNLGLSMGNYRILSKVLARNIDKAAHLKTVLLEFSLLAFQNRADEDAGYSASELWTLGIYEGNGLDFFWRHPLQSLRQFFYPIYYWRLTPRQILGTTFTVDKEVRAGHLAIEQSLKPEQARERAVSQVRDIANRATAENSASNLQAAQDIIALCRQRGLRVILLRMPHHHTYASLLPAEWLATEETVRRRLTEEPGVETWDYFSWENVNDSQFYNLDHLNAAGAVAFAKELDRRLGDELGAVAP